MVTGAPVALTVPLYGIVIVSLLMWSSYRAIARVFKWLTLVLLAYVVTAFVAHVDWRACAVRDARSRTSEWSRAFFSVLVAILGTTISPYLFFWQAAQEVEEERAMGRDFAHRRGATPEELASCRTDVVDRHVRLERDHVFHHPDDGGDAARARADEHHHGAAGGRGAASAGRRGRVLAVHARTDRHRHAGGAGPRRIVRLRHRRSGGLARIAQSTAPAGEEVLRRAGGVDGPRHRAQLRRARRDQAAVHDRGDQRRARAAADPDRPAADERSDGDGRRRQFAAPRLPRDGSRSS